MAVPLGGGALAIKHKGGGGLNSTTIKIFFSFPYDDLNQGSKKRSIPSSYV